MSNVLMDMGDWKIGMLSTYVVFAFFFEGGEVHMYVTHTLLPDPISQSVSQSVGQFGG